MSSKNHLTEMTNNINVNSKDSWIIDTDASSYFLCNKDLFTTFGKVTNTATVCRMSVTVYGYPVPVESKRKTELLISNGKMYLTLFYISKIKTRSFRKDL